jgi:hypothetical protein
MLPVETVTHVPGCYTEAIGRISNLLYRLWSARHTPRITVDALDRTGWPDLGNFFCGRRVVTDVDAHGSKTVIAADR